MAIKATGIIYSQSPQAPGEFGLHVSFTSHDTGYTGPGELFVQPFDGTTTQAEMLAEIKAAMKADMLAHGASFDILDLIRLINLNLVNSL